MTNQLFNARLGSMSREYYQKWYEANKDRRNAARRERYQRDGTYRARQVSAARDYRAGGRKADVEATTGPSAVMYVAPGKEVALWTIGDIARTLGITTQTIRVWEIRGLLPAPTIDSGKRMYTKKQAKYITKLHEKMQKCGHGLFRPEVARGLASLVTRIQTGWDG